jgi:hypothetical protein
MSVQNLMGDYRATYCQNIQPAQNRQTYQPQSSQESQTQSNQDQVSLSQGGRLLSSGVYLFSEEIEADGVVTLEEMKQFFQEKSADLESEIRTRLSVMGIDPRQALDLDVAADGSIKVANDHPQKAEIEAMFANDPELSNRVRQVTSTGSFIKAAERHLEFAAAYEKDPVAAVAQYAHLFSALQPSYMLRMDGDGLSLVEQDAA